MAKKKRVSFDAYLEGKLEDETFRCIFEEQRNTLLLGAELGRLRKQRGLSLSRVAQLAGMHKQNVARLERPDYTGYTVNSLRRVAQALGCYLSVRLVSEGEEDVSRTSRKGRKGKPLREEDLQQGTVSEG